jgi:hypothetical protein
MLGELQRHLPSQVRSSNKCLLTATTRPLSSTVTSLRRPTMVSACHPSFTGDGAWPAFDRITTLWPPSVQCPACTVEVDMAQGSWSLGALATKVPTELLQVARPDGSDSPFQTPVSVNQSHSFPALSVHPCLYKTKYMGPSGKCRDLSLLYQEASPPSSPRPCFGKPSCLVALRLRVMLGM